MVNGAVLESGEPQAVRSNRLVQFAYLGEHDFEPNRV
jgi:ABC-type branched-subunit amino acid transport system ATPase component